MTAKEEDEQEREASTQARALPNANAQERRISRRRMARSMQRDCMHPRNVCNVLLQGELSGQCVSPPRGSNDSVKRKAAGQIGGAAQNESAIGELMQRRVASATLCTLVLFERGSTLSVHVGSIFDDPASLSPVQSPKPDA